MVPTLSAVLGVKGHRPVVGTRDDKDLVHAFGSAEWAGGRLVAGLLVTRAKALRSARLAGRRRAVAKTRRMADAFAAHLRRVGRAFPAAAHRRVVLVIDNAPWHRGPAVAAALAANPHLGLYRLPAYSPHLNPIERLWKPLRRRATHNVLFDTVDDLARAVRAGLRHFRRVRRRVKAVLGNRPRKRTTISGP